PPPAVNASPAPTTAKVDRREPVDKLVITVTPDAENHVIVDITGAKDAAFIRERMFSKLRIPDDDHENYQIYRTELGEAALGDPVTDDQLMIYCGAWADAKGTLKFLVQRDPTALPPQPEFVAPTQKTTTPHVQTPPAIPNPTPPFFSPSYDRRRADNAAGGLSSADQDRDRSTWDMSYGYDGDGSHRRRHQAPAPIDTRRRRVRSASGSDFSSFSPTSPSGPQAEMTPLIAVPSRRPQPSQLASVSAATAYLNPNTPVAHRRRESDTAAMGRQALEAQERYREAQQQDYDAQYKKGRAEKDRQSRRQQIYSSEGPTPSGHKAHRSESVDSSAPYGWVLVNEVSPPPTSATGPDRYGNSQRTPPYGRSSATSGVSDWVGSPPSEGPRMSPAIAATPSASRPYPHATSTSYTATTPTLTRAHPPLSGGTGKYPNPHPHPRTGTGGHAALPPGAVDPRIRQVERQQPPAGPPNQFYSPSVSATYNPPPIGYVPPQQPTPPSSRMLQPSGNSPGAETAGGSHRTLRSPRFMSDLNQPNVLNSTVPPLTSQSSNQIPTLARKPNGPPTNSLLSDGLYNPSRQPTPLNRLLPTPSRPFTNPTWLYNGPSSGSARTPGGPQDYNNGLPRSLGSGAGLFNSALLADGPLNMNPALRAKPSMERMNAVDRYMAAHVQLQVRDQGPPLQGPPFSTPGPSSSYKAGWLSNTSSPAPSRPNSGDVDNGDFNRPSPIEKSAMDALSMLETRRPSLPMANVPTTPLESTERLASPWRETPAAATAVQIPKAVVTPSSPIDPSTATIGVQLYDNPNPTIATATSPALSSTSSTEFTDDGSEGTLKPGDRERLLSMADNDGDEEGTGTMKPGANRVTFSQVAIPVVVNAKAKRISMRQARAKSVRRPPQQDAGEGGQPNGEDEEEEYYYSSDSSEEDQRFWNTSSAPSAIATPPAIKTSGPEDDGNSTLGPLTRSRGPNLTVMISPLVDDRGSPMPTPSTAATNLPTSRENSPSPLASALTPTSGINRRASFRRDTWAFRPIQEDVLDHLQDFFPDHDLDKPFIDQVQIANEGLASPAGDALPPPVPAPVSREAKLKHRKSIRFVAEERKKVLERVRSAREPSVKAYNLGRKSSTKLWGVKVEEVTPCQVQSGMPPTISDSLTGPAPRPAVKWVKGELIGQGTYGRVFIALNVTTGEMMAVKQVEMPQTISDHDNIRQVSILKALKAEQQILEKLDHPNIVQYLGFLEYVPGGSIGSCLRRHGKFEENIIKSFTRQITDGLAYLHSNKTIHRDLKADNLLVDPSGNCKISDFGISKHNEGIYNNATMTAMQGSIFWMAPEMLYNDKKGYNAKIDIWSLGCVLIEMFSARRPWEQEDLVSVILKVVRMKMAPPVPSDVYLSAAAEDFRLKCFAQDPDQRPTAEGLKDHPWLELPPGWIFTGVFEDSGHA
ncbi:hypothetical protein FRC01_004196, partial [Tulasnella sp. 417]